MPMIGGHKMGLKEIRKARGENENPNREQPQETSGEQQGYTLEQVEEILNARIKATAKSVQPHLHNGWRYPSGTDFGMPEYSDFYGRPTGKWASKQEYDATLNAKTVEYFTKLAQKSAEKIIIIKGAILENMVSGDDEVLKQALKTVGRTFDRFTRQPSTIDMLFIEAGVADIKLQASIAQIEYYQKRYGDGNPKFGNF